MKIKFNRLLVSIVGIVLLIGIGCLLWFAFIKPAKETLEAKQQEYQPLQQYNEQLLVSTQQKKEVEFRKADMAEKLYDSYMNRFMPMLDFGRRDTGMIDYWREYTSIKSVLEKFGNDPNLTTKISLSVPNPPTNPNDSLFDQPFITYNGIVTVIGDFTSILDNIVRWSQAPRLVQVDANSISMNMSGDDPNRITASYAIRCFVIPWSTGGSKVEMATGGVASSTNSYGMNDGMPGMSGMPGGPGMMPGGGPGPMPGGPGSMPGGSALTPGNTGD